MVRPLSKGSRNNQKRLIKPSLILLFSLITAPLFSQESQRVTTPDTGVFRQALYSASGTFTDLNNWNAGGENNAIFSLLMRENKKRVGPNWTTVHFLEANYGISRQASAVAKNADKIEWTSTVTGSPKKTRWNVSGQANVRSQFSPGYAAGDTIRVPISTFGAPIYGQFSLGVGHNSWKHWQVFVSPVSAKTTTVLDAELRNKGAFGLDTGSTWRLEAGSKITLNYSEKITENMSITAKSDVFVSYSAQLNTIDVALEVIALYKVKKYVSLNAHIQLLRDLDQVDAWQRRSVLGIGLAYTIP